MNKDSSLRDKIVFLLTEHGLSVSFYNEWIVANGNLPGFSVDIGCENAYETHYSLQLNVDVAVDAETVMVECFGGFGQERETAINDAIANFAANSLHPLLAVFYGQYNEHVSVEKWEIAGRTWNVTIGNYGIRRLGDFTIEVPAGVLTTIESLVKPLRLEGKYHWLRLYYGHVNPEDITCEVLLDNEPWELAQDQIAQLAWPHPQAFYSVRLFLILSSVET